MTEPVAQKIFVIDDDAETRRRMAACLGWHGCETLLVAPVRLFELMAPLRNDRRAHD
jgi:hypothetical protein